VRGVYSIAALFILSSTPAYSQTQTPKISGKPAAQTNSESGSAADECSEADKREVGRFAARYPWYVRVIRYKVREKWLMSEVGAQVQSATRVCLNFDINRTGEPSNVRIAKSSGVPSLDESVLRAVHRVSSFGPLPPEYEWDKVSVLFWFDYRPRKNE
jgi:TonB family protein